MDRLIAGQLGIFLLCMQLVQARVIPDTDSLETQLTHTTGKDRITLLNKLSEVYKLSVPSKAIEYGQQALTLARQMANKPEEATALNNIGEYYLSNGQYDKALEQFKQVLAIGQGLANSSILAVALHRIGVANQFMGNYDEALVYHFKALAKLENNSPSVELGLVLSSICYVYNNQGLRQKALDYGLRALKVRQAIGDKNEIVKSLNTLGDFYLRQNNLPKALENYLQSYRTSAQANNIRGVAFAMNNIGAVYTKQGNHAQALQYYLNALALNKKLDSKRQIANSLSNIGSTYLTTRDYGKALEYLNESLALYKTAGSKPDIVGILNLIGKTHTQQSKLTDALHYQHEALQLAEVIRSKPLLQDTYEALAQTYLFMNNAAQCMKYYRLFTMTRDSLRKEANELKLVEMQAEFEKTENQRELELVKKEKKIQQLALNRYESIRNYLILCSILSVGLSIVLYSFYKHKRKSNQELKKQHEIISGKNQELSSINDRLQTLNIKLQASEAELRNSNETKDKFFSIISHDLRSPVATFTAFVSIMLTKMDTFTPEQMHQVILSAEKSLRNLSSLLNNLLQWSQTQMGYIKYEPETVLLHEAAQQTVSLLGVEANNKEIQMNTTVQENVLVIADKNMLGFVLRNLVANAIKFTPIGGRIHISCQQPEASTLEVTVSDTGVGIAQENIEKLFKVQSSFTTLGTAHEKGTGLGLLLCKEFVEKNGGRIWVESNPGQGTHFKFTLPLYMN